MFDRFTDRARKVMSLSRYEAQCSNGEFIGPEHILLGMISEGNGTAVKALKNLGLDLEKVRKSVKEKCSNPAPENIVGQIQFSPRGKRVIELAGEAASQLGHGVVGTEHLLLAIIKENESVAATVLIENGVKLDAVRDEILEVLGGIEVTLESPKYSFTVEKDAPSLEGVVSAVRMIKGIGSVEPIRSTPLTGDAVKHIREVIKILLEAAQRLEKISEDEGRGCV